MERKGLTLTVVMLAESANYGEGFGNFSVLKKISRGDHNQYSYISRQALRYNIVNQLQWDATPVANQGVVQFAPEATIEKFPEIDLFGYMKTTSKSDQGDNGTQVTRPAVARLSNAVALEPFNGDVDYLTNMGLARRNNLKEDNVIAQAEIQRSYYAYTLTVDLDRVGVDVNNAIDLSLEEKANRVAKLLEAVQFLYRDIKGRREDLRPLFVVGGVYARKCPYFMHRVAVNENAITVDSVVDAKESCDDAKKHTLCGVVPGIFKNEKDIKERLAAASVSDFFKNLTAGMKAEYDG